MKSIMKTFVLLIAAAGILLAGCSGDHAHDEDSDHTHETETQTTEAEHAHEEEEEDHAEEGAVHLTQLQLETAGIEMGRVQQLPLENSIKVNGFLELPPQNQANVSAVLGGLVQKIYVREGDQIKPVNHWPNWPIRRFPKYRPTIVKWSAVWITWKKISGVKNAF